MFTCGDTPYGRLDGQHMDTEDKYRTIIERFSDGILVLQNGFVSFLNPAIMEITGFTWKELSMRPAIKFVHPEDRQQVQTLCQRISAEELDTCKLEFRIITREKAEKWVSVRTNRIVWEDSSALLVFLTDLSILRNEK